MAMLFVTTVGRSSQALKNRSSAEKYIMIEGSHSRELIRLKFCYTCNIVFKDIFWEYGPGEYVEFEEKKRMS